MGCGTSVDKSEGKQEETPVIKLQTSKPNSRKNTILFEDPDFLCTFELPLIGNNNNNSDKNLDLFWLRPHELVKRPELYVDGTSRRDVMQGILGDCWLLSTCAALAKKEDLLFRVLPPDQPLYGEGYNGSVKLKIWQFGDWIEVVIDDRLPTFKGKYIYGHCADPTEFWVAFIEKAFAKLYGSYEALQGGMPIEAMVDLTGGLAERYVISQKPELLYEYIRRSFSANAFITCSRRGDWRRAHASDVNGLVQGHAYTITGIYRVPINADQEPCNLIRIRNPWGDNNEWKGSWSDKDDNWSKIDPEVKGKIGLQYKADGEFWMDFFADFVREFEEVSICTMGPDFDLDGEVDQALSTIVIKGSWIPGVNAGGCRNNYTLFATNPIYKITVSQDTNQVIVSLSQKKVAKKRLHQIGFTVYSVESDAHNFNEDFFRNSQALGSSGSYINYREIFARFTLSRGEYIIVPATFAPNIGCDFLLRIFSQETVNLEKVQ